MINRIYPPKRNESMHPQIARWKLTAVSSMRAREWKQHKCLSIGKWIHKVCSIRIMEYYSATERNEALKCWNVVEPWKHYAKTQKATYHMISFLRNVQNRLETESRIVVVAGEGRERMGRDCQWAPGFFFFLSFFLDGILLGCPGWSAVALSQPPAASTSQP